MFHNAVDVRNNHFEERLTLAQNIVSELNLENISVKTFRTGNFFEAVKEVLEEEVPDGVVTDGIIFQPEEQSYRNQATLKWKPPQQLTIDFLLQPVGDEEDTYNLMTREKVDGVWMDRRFTGDSRNPYPGTVAIPGGVFQDTSVSGRILEFRWVYATEDDDEGQDGDATGSEGGFFEPYRFRTDREQANGLDVAKSVWRDINDPISAEDLMGETLKIMRKYHNSIKLKMLKSNVRPGSTILDIGSGRGGDISKWDAVGIKKVYAVEPNRQNYNEMVERIEQIRPRVQIEFVESEDGELVGAENTRATIETLGDDKVDAVVSFFSLTFFGRDPLMFDSFIKSVDATLSTGGRFIGIVMDGEEVAKKLEESEDFIDDPRRGKGKVPKNSKLNRIETSQYTIQQAARYNEDLIFGAPIDIDLHDPDAIVKRQREWLFPYSILRHRLLTMGYRLRVDQLINQENMEADEVRRMPIDSLFFSEAMRWFVFEKLNTDTSNFVSGSRPLLIPNLPSVEGKTVRYLGNPRDPSNMIQAIANGARNQAVPGEQVENIRLVVSNSMNLTTLSKLPVRGLTASAMRLLVGFDYSAIGPKREGMLELLKQWVATPDIPLNDDLLPAVVDALERGINIAVIYAHGKVAWFEGDDTPTIVLYTPDSSQYFLVTLDEQIQFSKEDPFIIELLERRIRSKSLFKF